MHMSQYCKGPGPSHFRFHHSAAGPIAMAGKETPRPDPHQKGLPQILFLDQRARYSADASNCF